MMNNTTINMEDIVMNMLEGIDSFEEAKTTHTPRAYELEAPREDYVAKLMEMAERKHITFDKSRVTTYLDAKNYMQELYDAPFWKELSEKQITLITDLCEQCNMPLPDFDKLNGAYNASASQFIKRLQALAKTLPQKISDEQLKTIIKMQLCPDCEFVAEPEKMMKEEATEYINKYQNAYSAWWRDRLTAEQVARIKQLHDMMETPFSYQSVIQLDRKTATAYIIQLESEFNRKDWQETTLEPENMYKVKTKDNQDVYEMARSEMRKVCANLYASIGQQIEDDFFETMDWSGLKDLIGLVQIYGTNVRPILEDCKVLNPSQVEALLA